MQPEIRKYVVNVDEIYHDGGPVIAKPLKKGWVAVILKNPFAGRYVEDVQPMMDALKPVGLEASTRLLKALGGDTEAIEAYGKGSLIGSTGEMEHGALWHVPGGYAMRELLGKALSIVPSAAKVAAIGTAIDIPIHHRNAAYVRSHFDAVTVTVPDGPRADEMMFILAMTTGGRPHARMGGLAQADIAKWDGQR